MQIRFCPICICCRSADKECRKGFLDYGCIYSCFADTVFFKQRFATRNRLHLGHFYQWFENGCPCPFSRFFAVFRHCSRFGNAATTGSQRRTPFTPFISGVGHGGNVGETFPGPKPSNRQLDARENSNKAQFELPYVY